MLFVTERTVPAQTSGGVKTVFVCEQTREEARGLISDTIKEREKTNKRRRGRRGLSLREHVCVSRWSGRRSECELTDVFTPASVNLQLRWTPVYGPYFGGKTWPLGREGRRGWFNRLISPRQFAGGEEGMTAQWGNKGAKPLSAVVDILPRRGWSWGSRVENDLQWRLTKLCALFMLTKWTNNSLLNDGI